MDIQDKIKQYLTNKVCVRDLHLLIKTYGLDPNEKVKHLLDKLSSKIMKKNYHKLVGYMEGDVGDISQKMSGLTLSDGGSGSGSGTLDQELNDLLKRLRALTLQQEQTDVRPKRKPIISDVEKKKALETEITELENELKVLTSKKPSLKKPVKKGTKRDIETELQEEKLQDWNEKKKDLLSQILTLQQELTKVVTAISKKDLEKQQTLYESVRDIIRKQSEKRKQGEPEQTRKRKVVRRLNKPPEYYADIAAQKQAAEQKYLEQQAELEEQAKLAKLAKESKIKAEIRRLRKEFAEQHPDLDTIEQKLYKQQQQKQEEDEKEDFIDIDIGGGEDGIGAEEDGAGDEEDIEIDYGDEEDGDGGEEEDGDWGKDEEEYWDDYEE